MKCNNCECQSVPDYFQGKEIAELQGIYPFLKELDKNYKTWVTRYECSECGQIWEERFIQKGHGEVPEVAKVESKTKCS